MKRAWLAALALAAPVHAAQNWQDVEETAAAVVSIDVAGVQVTGNLVRFHERQVMRAGQLDPGSLRPLREVLEKRVVDCRKLRIATLSRAVFSDADALIDHRAVRLQQAEWRPLPRDDARFKLLCRRP